MRAQTILSSIHGFPRIGARRELKTATEAYWSGQVGEDELLDVARRLRHSNLELLVEGGLDLVPANDFSLYDHVLDTSVLVGAVPERYADLDGLTGLDRYFAMARGHQRGGVDVAALEMTKWFDTNYHYIVPELAPDTDFSLQARKPFTETAEARTATEGRPVKTVLLGPVTFLLLAKTVPGVPPFDRLKLLDPLLGVYAELLGQLRDAGATWVQFDEPAFAQDRPPAELDALARAYERLGDVVDRPRLLVATYFDRAGDALDVLADAPVEGIGVDLCRGSADLEHLERIAARGGLHGKTVAAGVVNGRNVWANDLEGSLSALERLADLTPELHVSSSCSLLHVPISLQRERRLDAEVRSWLAFATEKVHEISVLTRALRDGREAVAEELATSRARQAHRAASARVLDAAVRGRLDGLSPADRQRPAPYDERAALQSARLQLPLLPTTTIGSFPQTPEVRNARRDLLRGRLDAAAYDDRMKAEIRDVVRLQETAGLDVIVHGEPERNDMVQYFAEHLEGFAFTQHGWVQSFGTRYTRPPIIHGGVSRPSPISVKWTTYAQSLTDRPVKGMLTGPVTMLLWSFARDDQALGDTCRQIALAIRDEVADLDAAGVPIIQVDEPAIREGLPLRREGRDNYLHWAVDGFRLATAVARPETQVHTHMCYAEFGDIIDAIADLDADVASIEAARSQMDLLDAFATRGYDKGMGPGAWDIHSPRVPPVAEIVELLERAIEVLGVERVWVNPDCGLKTRGYAEVEAALGNLVEAARGLRP